jgi:hypothetical protein
VIEFRVLLIPVLGGTMDNNMPLCSPATKVVGGSTCLGPSEDRPA